MFWSLVVLAAVAAACASVAPASAPPVGPLPKGPAKTVKLTAGATFTASLPKPKVAGRVWRIARGYDAKVVHELAEGTPRTASG